MATRRRALEAVVINDRFWHRKKVLVTGHTGFKGSWISLWLQKLGANIVGLALPPLTSPSLFEKAKVSEGMISEICDIRDLEAVKETFQRHRPEIVIHMAAQSLVRYSYDRPVETYETNVLGTLHVLEAIRNAGTVQVAVMVTSDKCYENREWEWAYRETEAMGGYDPYSSSKGCAELLIASYRRSFFEQGDGPGTAIASARAGNVIGGGDWGTDRLIPDIIRAFQKGEPVRIRNPHAVRPWQHVLEPLSGYLVLAEQLYEHGAQFAEGWNFGPYESDSRPVRWIVEKMTAAWGDKASWSEDGTPHPHEASHLTLDSAKAHSRLAWRPKWPLEYSLDKIVKWHKSDAAGAELKAICLSQIDDYNASKETKR